MVRVALISALIGSVLIAFRVSHFVGIVPIAVAAGCLVIAMVDAAFPPHDRLQR